MTIISIVIVYVLSAFICYHILKYGYEQGMTTSKVPMWTVYCPVINTMMCLVVLTAVIVSLFKYITK